MMAGQAKFREDSFQKAVASLAEGGGEAGRRNKGGKRKGPGVNDVQAEASGIFKIVRMIMEREYQPVSNALLLLVNLLFQGIQI